MCCAVAVLLLGLKKRRKLTKNVQTWRRQTFWSTCQDPDFSAHIEKCFCAGSFMSFLLSLVLPSSNQYFISADIVLHSCITDTTVTAHHRPAHQLEFCFLHPPLLPSFLLLPLPFLLLLLFFLSSLPSSFLSSLLSPPTPLQ